MRRVAIACFFVIVFALIGLCYISVLDRHKSRHSQLEFRVDLLEKRVGELCIIEYGKSTGFDKAIIRKGKK